MNDHEWQWSWLKWQWSWMTLVPGEMRLSRSRQTKDGPTRLALSKCNGIKGWKGCKEVCSLEPLCSWIACLFLYHELEAIGIVPHNSAPYLPLWVGWHWLCHLLARSWCIHSDPYGMHRRVETSDPDEHKKAPLLICRHNARFGIKWQSFVVEKESSYDTLSHLTKSTQSNVNNNSSDWI